jgi:hypothetical protein
MANRVSAEPATSAEPAAAAAMRLRRPATAAVSTPATVSAREVAGRLGPALLVGFPGQSHPLFHHLLGDDLGGAGQMPSRSTGWFSCSGAPASPRPAAAATAEAANTNGR